jgi:arsenate reductase-like glutaredoxin family protein
MSEYPILIERPILFNNKEAVIGRPEEKILNFLKVN